MTTIACNYRTKPDRTLTEHFTIMFYGYTIKWDLGGGGGGGSKVGTFPYMVKIAEFVGSSLRDNNSLVPGPSSRAVDPLPKNLSERKAW